jgi:hypothetical protein
MKWPPELTKPQEQYLRDQAGTDRTTRHQNQGPAHHGTPRQGAGAVSRMGLVSPNWLYAIRGGYRRGSPPCNLMEHRRATGQIRLGRRSSTRTTVLLAPRRRG